MMKVELVGDGWPTGGRKKLKNRACQAGGASLGSGLFLGKPLRASGPHVAVATQQNDDLWQLKFA